MPSRMLFRLSAAILLSTLILGCSNGSTTAPLNTLQPLTAPTFAGPTPGTTSADTITDVKVAQIVATSFNLVFQSYLQFFSGQGTQQGSSWTWVSQSSTLTATAELTVNGGNYHLTLTFNGTYQNANYGNAIVMSGTESSDGKNGSWSITTPSEDSQLVWSTDNTGTLTGTFTSSGSSGQKLVIADKADGSGELKIYNGSILGMDVTWKSDGTGQWIDYDPNTGTQIDSGSWT